MPRKFTVYPKNYIRASKFTDIISKIANSYRPYLKTMSLDDIWNDIVNYYGDECIADLVVKELR